MNEEEQVITVTRSDLQKLIDETVKKTIEQQQAQNINQIQNSSKDRLTKMEPPEPFMGDMHKSASFIVEMETFFDYNHNTFQNDKQKIQFVCSRLRGIANDWKTDLYQEKHQCLENFGDFWNYFTENWIEKNERINAKKTIKDCKQQPQESVMSYSIRLKTLSTRARQSDEDRVLSFLDGLLPDIQDKLIGQGASHQDFKTAKKLASDVESDIAQVNGKQHHRNSSHGKDNSRNRMVGEVRPSTSIEESPRKRFKGISKLISFIVV